MTRPPRRKHDDGHDRRLDNTVADSFPASDPPSHTGITCVGGRAKSKNPSSTRPPSHERGSDARPTGQPTWDRHATETSHSWKDERKS
jgi:hypothetical protein